jgi:hypothetical protein
MTFGVAHWDALDDSLEFYYARIFLSLLMARLSCVYILVCERKIFLSILVASVICGYFSQLVDHRGTQTSTS